MLHSYYYYYFYQTRNVYFDVCRLHQQNAKESLQEYTERLRELVIIQMKTFHYDYNTDICANFEALKNKALKEIPKETKELVEFGKN